jgi:hypothetical protein
MDEIKEVIRRKNSKNSDYDFIEFSSCVNHNPIANPRIQDKDFDEKIKSLNVLFSLQGSAEERSNALQNMEQNGFNSIEMAHIIMLQFEDPFMHEAVQKATTDLICKGHLK